MDTPVSLEDALPRDPWNHFQVIPCLPAHPMLACSVTQFWFWTGAAWGP